MYSLFLEKKESVPSTAETSSSPSIPVTPLRRKSVDPIDVDTLPRPVAPLRRKSVDPPSPIDVDALPKSVTPTTPIRQKSINPLSSMIVDDDRYERRSSFGDNRQCSLLLTDKEYSQSRSGSPSLRYENPYLTTKEFNYTMKVIDDKFTALYQLCRHISKQLEENSKSLKKIVAVDELSESFWNVSL